MGTSIANSIRMLTEAVNMRTTADALHEQASDAILDLVRVMVASASTQRDPGCHDRLSDIG